MATFVEQFKSLFLKVLSDFDNCLFSVFPISTRNIFLRYLSMVMCLSKQIILSQVFHLKHFSSATNNLKVLPYWNISYVKIMTYGYRDDSFILPLQVQDTHFFSCYVTFTNCIIKQFTNSISESLSKKFSNQEIFNTAKVEYKDVLNKSGYNAELKLQEESRICK